MNTVERARAELQSIYEDLAAYDPHKPVAGIPTPSPGAAEVKRQNKAHKAMVAAERVVERVGAGGLTDVERGQLEAAHGVFKRKVQEIAA